MSNSAREAIQDAGNILFLSAVSFVEMGIKISLRKLTLSAPSNVILESYLSSGIGMLTITPEHGIALESLPYHHRDPFDRLLAAQALAEDLTLISRDGVFDLYGVKRIW